MSNRAWLPGLILAAFILPLASLPLIAFTLPLVAFTLPLAPAALPLTVFALALATAFAIATLFMLTRVRFVT